MGKHFVILGNGIAGLSAAEAIRGCQRDAEITMVSEEPGLTFLRPLLSKTWFSTLRGDRIRVKEPEWYEENRIQCMTGRKITELRPMEHEIVLEDGLTLPYDAAIYALGARSMIPSFQGRDKEGVVALRTLEDFGKLRRRLLKARQAVVIGGGVTGLETAWQLKQMGCQVTVLETASRVMERFLDAQSAEVLTKIMEEGGIACHTGVTVAEIEGGKEASGVRLEDGRVFPAGLIVAAAGIRANTELARDAGIACGKGVLADDFMRTSAPDLFAAGDCIQWRKQDPGLWTYAKASGETAGFNAARREAEWIPFRPEEESVILHMMGTGIFFAGNVPEEESGSAAVSGPKPVPSPDVCFRVNDPERGERQYTKKFYRDGKLTGAVLIGDLSEMEQIKSELRGEQAK